MVKSTYMIVAMYPSVGSYTKKQIASILCTEQSKINVHTMDVQMQAKWSDCGLFEIAFATAVISSMASPPREVCIQSGKNETSIPLFVEW